MFNTKKPQVPDIQLLADFKSGERGIRTPGASQHDGFQDRCNRPLYHLSIVMSTNFLSESECKGKQNYLYNIIFAVKNIPIYYLLTKHQQTN